MGGFLALNPQERMRSRNGTETVRVERGSAGQDDKTEQGDEDLHMLLKHIQSWDCRHDMAGTDRAELKQRPG